MHSYWIVFLSLAITRRKAAITWRRKMELNLTEQEIKLMEALSALGISSATDVVELDSTTEINLARDRQDVGH
jgi:hypothetical protein